MLGREDFAGKRENHLALWQKKKGSNFEKSVLFGKAVKRTDRLLQK